MREVEYFDMKYRSAGMIHSTIKKKNDSEIKSNIRKAFFHSFIHLKEEGVCAILESLDGKVFLWPIEHIQFTFLEQK